MSERNKNLDFLRGVAILLVMTGHFLPGYMSTHIGWSGVDLFFVLSGFFVSGILFREFIENGKISAGRFLIRRGLKIWPLFYTALIIHFVYYLLEGQQLTASQVLCEIFFIQNYFPGFMNVTWSLGIEEQFYLLLSLGLPLILKAGKPVKLVTRYCALVILLCIIFRIINFQFNPYYDPYKNFYPLHLRADSLCSGVILSYLYHFKREKFENFLLTNKLFLSIGCGVMLLPLFLYPYNHKFTYIVGFNFAYIGYFLLVALFLVSKRQMKLQKTTPQTFILSKIAWIGYYSYSIYLFHFFIGFGIVSNFRKLIGVSNLIWVEFGIFIASNIFFGFLASKVVEQPVLRWRDKRFPAAIQKI